MDEERYNAEAAAADLTEAGLLDGIVLAGPHGPEYREPENSTPDLVGGFAGAGLDSRTLVSGQLFVALKGDNVDGRDYISSVLEAGHWILADHADREPGRGLPVVGEMPAGTGILLTRDPNAALACLANAWRSRFDLRVAGITGTNGKTTTKDLLAAMLRAAAPTWATVGNYNNRLGLPMTLLGLTAKHRYAVIEMGASKVGDIAGLAPLAAPGTGVITNASAAHLAEFESLENIILGKGELLDALPASGCAVLNADSPGFGSWRDRAPCPVVSFGRAKADHSWLWRHQGNDGWPEIEMDGQAWRVPLPGEHNGANLAAALLAARSFGLADETIRAGLAGFTGSPHRGVLLEIEGRIVLDDCYNANPVSMVEAGRALRFLAGRGRVVAVLGAMAELGPDSANIHEETGKEMAAGPVDLLIAVGEKAHPLGVGFDAGGGVSHNCADLEEAARLAAFHTGPGDHLLIKGSRSVAMEELLPLLVEAFKKN